MTKDEDRDEDLDALAEKLLVDPTQNELVCIPEWFDEKDVLNIFHLAQTVIKDFGYSKEEATQWMNCFTSPVSNDWICSATYPSGRPLEFDYFVDIFSQLARYRYASKLERLKGIEFLYGIERVKYQRNRDSKKGKGTQKRTLVLADLYAQFCSVKSEDERTWKYFLQFLDGDHARGIVERVDYPNECVEFEELGTLSFKSIRNNMTKFKKIN